MRKIGLIGSIGHGKSTSSGQIIRTRILYKALLDQYGENGVCMINTSDYKHHAAGILIKTLGSLFSSDIYIVILSGNGRKVFFPILRFFKKAFKKRILNNIIGGDYASSVEKYPKYIKYSNSFDVNWVQMPSMKNEVEHVGIINVEVLPNSKPLEIANKADLKIGSVKPFHFCTFSRVSEAKGTELAINAIEDINREAGEMLVELTIYGKPDDDYAEEFDKVMQKVSSAIHYGGVIPFDKASQVLNQYYMLLFPTTFYGEGFPGTIIDAYASGLPVIASDWKFNPELIERGITGLVYDHKEPNDLKSCITYAINNPDKIDAMRENCVQEAQKYIPENVMPIIFNKIDALRK